MNQVGFGNGQCRAQLILSNLMAFFPGLPAKRGSWCRLLDHPAAKRPSAIVLDDRLLVSGDRTRQRMAVRYRGPNGQPALVNGELVGNIYASERVELTRKARVHGDVESPILVLEEGGTFEGRCRMPRPDAMGSARDATVMPLKRS